MRGFLYTVSLGFSAITTKVYKNEETALEFLVNDKYKMTAEEFNETYGEEGYKVEFKYNFNANAAEKAGVIKTTKAFKYAVQVKDAEGNLIPEDVTSDIFVDVVVVDSVAVTEVTEVGLVKGTDTWELDYITASDEGLTFQALAGLNAEGDVLEAGDVDVIMPDVKTVTALTPIIAYYESGVIKVRTEGTAEFEITFNGVDEAVVVDVEIKEAQEPAELANQGETVKIEAGKQTSVEFTVLDQYGEELRVNFNNDDKTQVEILDKNDEDALNDGDNGDQKIKNSKIKLEDLKLDAGTYTVVVTFDEEEIGSFTLVATDVSGDPDGYTLTPADGKAEIDVNVENGEEATLEITINAFIEGTKLTEFNTNDLLVKVSKDIAKVVTEDSNSGKVEIKKGVFTIQGVKDKVAKGESKDVVVTLFTKDGDYVLNLATLTVTIKNSEKPDYQVTDLAIKDGKDAIEVDGELNAKALVEALTTGDEDNPLTAEMIADFVMTNEKLVKGNVEATVVLTIEEAYGGNDFAFPVVIQPNAATFELTASSKMKEALNGNGNGNGNDENGLFTKENNNGAVIVNIARLQNIEFSEEEEGISEDDFWTATAQQGKPDTATTAYGGTATVNENNYTLKAVFSNAGSMTIYENGQDSELKAWLQIGKKVDGDWKFLDESDVREDVRTIVWEKNDENGGTEYKVNTFTIKWVYNNDEG